MSLSDEAKALEARNDAKKDQAFDIWMRDPLTRMALSMVPGGEHPEALRMLLRSAFDRGFGVGVGEILGDVLERIIAGKKDERRP